MYSRILRQAVFISIFVVLIVGQTSAQVFVDETASRLPLGDDPNDRDLNFITYGSHWGDIDLDGDLDIISINPAGQGRILLINQGGAQSGTLGVFVDETLARITGTKGSTSLSDLLRACVNPPASNLNQLGGEDPWMADFDNDGDLDIMIGVRAFVALYLENQGGAQSGTLGQFLEIQIPLDSNAIAFFPDPACPLNVINQAVDARDVDGDGDLDVILAMNNATGDTDNQVFAQNILLINQGGLQGGSLGVFVDDTAARLPVDIRTSNDNEFCDVDNDGDWDIVTINTASSESNQDTIWINNGSGVFTAEPSRLPASNSNGTYVVCHDVNDDGFVDLAISNFGANQLLINDGNGFFTDVTGTQFVAGAENSAVIGLYDFDLDGDLDAFVANGNFLTPQQDSMLINDGNGVFTDETSAYLPAATNLSQGSDGADFDGDGDVDIYVGGGARDGSGNPIGEQNRMLINTMAPVVTTKKFCLNGTGDGSGWSYGFIYKESNTPPALSGGATADEFATAFVDSINGLGRTNLSAATDPEDPACFEITFNGDFEFWVGDANMLPTCEVTGGGPGCTFNPTIVEFAPPPPAVPTGGLWLLLGLALALATLGAAALAQSRHRIQMH